MLKIRFERYVKLGECFVTGTGLLSKGMPGNREMLLTNLGRAIVKDIDRGVVISKDNIGIPRFDTSIPPSNLAGGTQALIYLLSHPTMPIRLECFGENCYKFIWEISGVVSYDLIFSITGFDQNLFEYAPNGALLECINDGTIIDNWEDFDNKRRGLFNMFGKHNIRFNFVLSLIWLWKIFILSRLKCLQIN